VRIIATTNRDLKQEVKDKKFREDLYYRLNVFPIHCLALRQRTMDILPLAESFLKKYSLQDSRGKLSFSTEAKAKLVGYQWPGNVRELDNLVQRVAVLSSAEIITAEDISFEGQSKVETEGGESLMSVGTDDSQLGSDMRHHEYQIIIESLAKCHGKKKSVAEQLGISARTLRYKIAKMREAGYSIPDKKSLA
jgi:two-component system, response regulator FlrC